MHNAARQGKFSFDYYKVHCYEFELHAKNLLPYTYSS